MLRSALTIPHHEQAFCVSADPWIRGGCCRGSSRRQGGRPTAPGVRRLHGEGAEGLERPWHRHRHRRRTTNWFSPRDTAIATTARSCRITARHDAADSLEHQAVHRHGRRACWSRKASSTGTSRSGASCRTIQFYNNELNNTITVRDMLAHRTGITRHDHIWYKSDSRETNCSSDCNISSRTNRRATLFLYNNMMYAGVGYATRAAVRQDLGSSSCATESFAARHEKHRFHHRRHAEATRTRRCPSPSAATRSSSTRSRITTTRTRSGPAGAIVSNIEDMSHWLIALMNNGKFNGKQVLPAAAVQATLEPAHRAAEHGRSRCVAGARF